MKGDAPPSRVGAIGDIHSEDDRLAAALDFLRSAGAELVVAVGDIVDGPGDVDRCCALLQNAGALAVAGNHERWLFEGRLRSLPHATRKESLRAETRAYLGALPKTRAIETAAGPLLLCHGVGADDMVRLTPDSSGYDLFANAALQALLARGEHRVMIGGHTHRRMVRTFGKLLALNPGTLARDDGPGFLLADFAAGRARFYDITAALEIAEAEEIALPG
jgi:putative phosphoesterase